MTERKAFIEKLAVQLKQWDSEIEKLEAKARRAESAAKAEYNKHIQDLRKKEASAHDRLEEIKQAGEDAWEELKSGAEKVFNETKNSIQAAWSKFK